ncbi:Smr/MutS family protein [Mycoplasma hafezii]|uniref:Smr/MutS family protein n=1 Tax=Mycoplasma hafezii TaxID=525886 RepID=UPI003CE93F6D
MKIVDLHGLESQEASIVVFQYINEFKKRKIDAVMFITGKGTGILQATVEKMLEQNNLNYVLENDRGAYYVSQATNYDYFYNQDFDDDDNEIIDELEIEDIFEKFKK